MADPESGAERLSAEVLADARRKADRRRQAARRDADKILQQARDQAQREADRIIEEAQRRADRQRSLILATVDQEIHRRRLIRQARVLEGLIQAGFDRAADRQEGDRRRALIDLTVAAIEQMDAEAFHLQVSAADRTLVDADFVAEVGRQLGAAEREPPELTLEEEPAPIAGGVIVRAADATQMVDNSLEARRRRLGPQLRQVLAEMIFADRQEPRATESQDKD